MKKITVDNDKIIKNDKEIVKVLIIFSVNSF